MQNSAQPTRYDFPWFTLTLSQTRYKTNLHMELKLAFVNSFYWPQTYQILHEMLPSVLVSHCYNDEKLPFEEEVKRTEIGHLFEHVLLEYLCQEKLKRGYRQACFSGYTSWNWVTEKRGSFHIELTSGYNEAYLFSNALEKTVYLVNQILISNQDLFIISQSQDWAMKPARR